MVTKGTPLRYLTATGIIGYGFLIEHAGNLQHSIAWPDKPGNRMKEDELAEHGIKYGELFPPVGKVEVSPTTVESDPEVSNDGEANPETQASQLESEAETDIPQPVEFVFLKSETEANNIRNYITSYPKASNQEVIAGLNAFGLEVSSGQVSYNRKRLAELNAETETIKSSTEDSDSDTDDDDDLIDETELEAI